jgi:hypothetical protein
MTQPSIKEASDQRYAISANLEKTLTSGPQTNNTGRRIRGFRTALRNREARPTPWLDFVALAANLSSGVCRQSWQPGLVLNSEYPSIFRARRRNQSLVMRLANKTSRIRIVRPINNCNSEIRGEVVKPLEPLVGEQFHAQPLAEMDRSAGFERHQWSVMSYR